MASSRVRTQRLEAGVVQRVLVNYASRDREGWKLLTNQLSNTIFIRIGARCPEASPFIRVRAKQDGNRGKSPFAVAYLGVP